MPATKLEPDTTTLVAGAPTETLAGARELIAGTGLRTARASVFEEPAGSCTERESGLAVARFFAGMVVVSVVAAT